MQFSTPSKFFKTADAKTGDTIQFLSEGEWVESKFQDKNGNPKKQFNILVSHNGSEKSMSINATNGKILIGKFGQDTKEWIGKTCEVEKIKINVSGELKDSIILK